MKKIADLYLRQAKEKDTNGVLIVSNDDEVRKNSFSTAKISLQDHLKWFSKEIRRHDCLFLVAEIDDKIIGYVRFEIDSVSRGAVISIGLKSEFQGKGYGKQIFIESLAVLKRISPSTRKIIAYVKRDNLISQLFFQSLDFKNKKKIIFRETLAIIFELDV